MLRLYRVLYLYTVGFCAALVEPTQRARDRERLLELVFTAYSQLWDEALGVRHCTHMCVCTHAYAKHRGARSVGHICKRLCMQTAPSSSSLQCARVCMMTCVTQISFRSEIVDVLRTKSDAVTAMNHMAEELATIKQEHAALQVSQAQMHTHLCNPHCTARIHPCKPCKYRGNTYLPHTHSTVTCSLPHHADHTLCFSVCVLSQERLNQFVRGNIDNMLAYRMVKDTAATVEGELMSSCSHSTCTRDHAPSKCDVCHHCAESSFVRCVCVIQARRACCQPPMIPCVSS